MKCGVLIPGVMLLGFCASAAPAPNETVFDDGALHNIATRHTQQGTVLVTDSPDGHGTTVEVRENVQCPIRITGKSAGVIFDHWASGPITLEDNAQLDGDRALVSGLMLKSKSVANFRDTSADKVMLTGFSVLDMDGKGSVEHA